jgi:protein O-mannosyl-transferase
MKNKKEPPSRQPGYKMRPRTTIVSELPNRNAYIALGAIVIISFITYLPVFNNNLLSWDDAGYITNNQLIRSFNLNEIFSQFVIGNYHPLTIFILAVEYHIFGLNPAGYHAVNLLLHLLNIILVFKTVHLLSDKMVVALVAALLFGIHPIHVESVAWAAELKDLLYTFFFLAAYISYLVFLKHGQKKFYLFAFFLFSLSMLSKAMAASLPVVMLLTDYFKERRFNIRIFLEKVPFFILAIALGIVAIYAQKEAHAITEIPITTIFQRLVFASFGFITYLVRLFVPLNLSVIYPYPLNNGVYVPFHYFFYVIALAGLATYVIRSRRFTRKIIFGLGFFSATVFLVLQLLPVGDAMMADRYSYIPSVGIFYLAGEGCAVLLQKRQKMAASILIGLVAVIFSASTFARCSVWKNDMSFWNDVINNYQTVEYAYNNRGDLLMNENRFEEALADFNKATELKPDYAQAWYNRGNLYAKVGKPDEAVNDFSKAIELKPDFIEAHLNRGMVLMNEGKMDVALPDFDKAIELKPDALAHYNRGILWMNKNNMDKAIADFTIAISLNPEYFDAYINRGIILTSVKRYNEALKDYNNTIRLSPDNPLAYYNRGMLLMYMNNMNEALNDFTRAIELKPDYYKAYNKRGLIFLKENKSDQALADFNKSVEIMPDFTEAINNREMLLKLNSKK